MANVLNKILKKLEELLEAFKTRFNEPKPVVDTPVPPKPVETIVEAPKPVSGDVSKPVSDAPFGRDRYGDPSLAPAYTKCRMLWEHAMKAKVFNIFAHMGSVQEMEDAIVALGQSDWGKEWLSHDENAVMIDREYQKGFLGYFVEKTRDSQGNTTYKRHPA